MELFKVIGLSGKRGSGKDSLAYAMAPYGWARASFAAELKRRCQMDFGLTEDQTDGAFKEQPTQYRRSGGEFLTPRDVMIRCGIYYRSIDPMFWVKRTWNDIQSKASRWAPCGGYCGHDKFVITDVRYRNEADYVKQHGGILVRLERDPALSIYKGKLNDPSETELDDYKGFDLVVPAIENVDLDDLARVAKTLEDRYGRSAGR